jgi:MoaA/NifB/PqqE/SkfB family radical SAM enzyme
MKKVFLKPASWTSFRSYLTPDGTARSLVFNEKTHNSFFLDGETSLIWSKIEEGIERNSLQEYSLTLSVGDELEDFLNQLEEDGLVQACESENTSSKSHPEPAPDPKAFENSEATEPLSDFMTWIADHGFLYSVHWEITWRCNERCIHCYNPGAAHLPHEKPERDTNELSTEEVFQVLDELRSIGVFRITLSGGEPMMRRDFWEVLARMRSMGFQVGIYTNGLKLLGENADRLATLYPNSVSISIYSDEPETHDKVTRIPGSFNKSTDVLRRMRDLGIATYMKSIQMNHTVRSYASVQKLADQLGAGAEVDMLMTASADGASAPLALAAQRPEELIVMAATPGSPLYVGSVKEGFHFIRRDPNSTVCGAGVTTMALDPEGNIVPCNSLPIPSGSIRKEGIASVWKRGRIHRRGNLHPHQKNEHFEEITDALSKWQTITLKDYHECGTHDRCLWCTKCPGLAMLEHGDPLAPSTTNCRLSTARMLAAGFLSSGETRESLCTKLGVDPAFGNLPAQNPELAASETVRGTGFSPKSAAIENLGCGGGACSGCSSSLTSHGHTAFGHVTLRRGSQLTADALEQMYSVVEKMGCKQPPAITGAPPPPRKLSLA